MEQEKLEQVVPEKETAHPYKRLQVELAALIAATPPGERLMAEPQLSKQLGVSRATLREAMRTFEGQGLIRRRQGIGTFVVGNTHVLETGLEVLESIETIAHKSGLNVSLGSLIIEAIRANEEQANALQLALDAPLVKISRVIHAENRPVAYLIDTLPEDVLSPAELGEGFTGSVLDTLLRRGSPRLAKSATEIRSTPATPDVARALQIQRGDALLMLVAQLYAISGRIVDYSNSYFLPGIFRFRVLRKVGEPY